MIKKPCLCFLICFFLCSCSSTSPEYFTIGLIAPLTGEQAAFGNHCLNAACLAVAQMNDHGGIDGKKIKLCVMDDRGDVLEGINCFYRLAAGRVNAVIGGVTSSVAVGLLRAANDTKTLLLSPSATADIVDTQDDYVFRACFTDSYQGAQAARFLHARGYTSVAVLYTAGDAYSCGLKDAFCRECARLGIDISVTAAASSVAETDFTPQLMTIFQKEPSALYAPLYYASMGLYVLPQAKSLGYEGMILGGDAYDGIGRYVASPSLLENVVFTNHYDKNAAIPQVQSFVLAYTDRYGEAALGSFAALSYDCVYMLKAAAESGKPLRESLKELTFSGVSGTFSMGETGTPNKELVFIGFSDGKEILIDKEDKE